MSWKNTSDRYGSLSITLHWLTFFFLVGVYACIELREFFPRGSFSRETLKSWHFMLGLSVFLLASLRLTVRLSQVTPRIVPEPAEWQQMSAKIVHLALYGLMFGMPILGWLILSAEGKIISFFGMHLPPLIPANKELAEIIEEIHEVVGSTGFFLIGLHAAAALFHHFIQRDNTLVRMLPRRK